MIAFFKWIFSLFSQNKVDKEALFRYNKEAEKLETELKQLEDKFPDQVEDKNIKDEIDYWNKND
jgi:hypothetical protein